MGRKLGVTIACAIAATTLATTASADPAQTTSAGIDWTRVLVDLDYFARTGHERQTAFNAKAPVAPWNKSGDMLLSTAGNAWFGVAPRVVLVARDWGEAYRLAGDRLSLLDALRLSNSTRMVITRVRLSGARVTPFAQAGLGQWRVDTNLLPLTPRSTEIAGQIGGGVEMRLTRSWQLAAESTVTAIYREQRDVDSIPQTRLWSTMIASRVEF